MTGEYHVRTESFNEKRKSEETYAFANAIISCQVANVSFLIFGETEGRKLILLFVDAVGLQNRSEDRKSILQIQANIPIVHVDSRHLLPIVRLVMSIRCGTSFRFPRIHKKTKHDERTISSPGRAESTKSPKSTTSLLLGNRPGGTEPGLS